MLSSVLSSQRAVRVNIEIMRAFVRLRRAGTDPTQRRAAPLLSRIALNSEVGRHSGHRRELPRSRPIL